ncbi:MAG: hypothetical protein ACYC1M_04645 [Armatimonadota bacterium]
MTEPADAVSLLKQLSAEIGWGVGRIQAQAGVLAVSVAVGMGWDDANVLKTRVIAELTLVDTAGALLTDKGRELYRQIEGQWCADISSDQHQIGLACVQLLLNLPVVWPPSQTLCDLLQANYDLLG